MVYQIIISILLVVISGIAKAICDLSSDDKIKFKPEIYWVKSKSWVNKWKNGDPKQGEKFWVVPDGLFHLLMLGIYLD